MQIHELKITERYFNQLLSGEKKAELRYNDRNFKRGDTIIFREFDLKSDNYTGKKERFRITCITEYPIGLKKGYVMLSIEKDSIINLILKIGNEYTTKENIKTNGGVIFLKGSKVIYTGMAPSIFFGMVHRFKRKDNEGYFTITVYQKLDKWIE